jgi:hypothetical protein
MGHQWNRQKKKITILSLSARTKRKSSTRRILDNLIKIIIMLRNIMVYNASFPLYSCKSCSSRRWSVSSSTDSKNTPLQHSTLDFVVLFRLTFLGFFVFDLHVFLQIRSLSESHVTVQANMGFLTSVNHRVCFQAPTLRKRPLAYRAEIGFGATVDSHVLCQGPTIRKRPLAHSAPIGLDASVDSHVSFQVGSL